MAKKRARSSSDPLTKNVSKMVASGALDARAAAKLKPSVVRKIERMTSTQLRIVIKFYNQIGGGGAQPEPNGSIF